MQLNKQVDTFYQVDFSDLNFPMIVVFFNPKDIPDKYVARVFDLDKATDTMTIRDTLEGIRETIPNRFFRIDRSPEDHPSVVEVWM